MALTLQEKFEKAVKHINHLPPKGEYSPSNNERLQFYALFKQATVGPVKGKRPGMTSFVARAKWCELSPLLLLPLLPWWLQHSCQRVHLLAASLSLLTRVSTTRARTMPFSLIVHVAMVCGA